MKKAILIVFALVFSLGTQMNAQDAKSTFKKAKKALSSFQIDKVNNYAKLEESLSSFEAVPADSEIAKTSNFYNLKGEAYIEMSEWEFSQKAIKALDKRTVPNAASKAADAYKMAFSYATKKYHKKDALKGLALALSNITEEGSDLYSTGLYEEAYQSFGKTFEVHKILKENEKESVLDDKESFDRQLFVKVLCADKAGKVAEVMTDVETLYAANYKNVRLYTLYFTAVSDSDDAKAVEILEKGFAVAKEIAASDETVSESDLTQGLMYAEINYYLRKNKTGLLVDKLKVAIEKDSKNKTLYSTLGNVYDKIYQAKAEANEETAATEAFDNAKLYYEKALEIDPDFFDATYSIGALYYNQAASLTKQLNKLGEDYSKAGMKKYDAFKVGVDAKFAEALPYFKKAEQINPKDINTLLALSEISARSGDLAGATEYKAKIEALK